MIRLTVAFASARHAEDAVRFLDRATLLFVATPRPIVGDGDLALVDIEIPNGDRLRLATLLGGLHAFVIHETEIASLADRVA